MAAISGVSMAAVTCRAAGSKAAGPMFAPCAGLKSGKALRVFSKKASVEEGFAKLAVSCRSSGKGALGARCDIASEVFGVIPVIFGMIFTGIALGFVLLRVEAALEEDAQKQK